jgi:mono/diheme cytochrome c family protein
MRPQLSRSWPRWLLAAVLLQNAWLLYPRARDVIVRPEATAYTRGRHVAERLGCFACHGPDGGGGAPNVGGRADAVPGWTERVPMMYAASDDELREYILDGRPAAKAADPEYVAEMERQAIRMPAYRGRISDAEVEEVLTFIRAVSGLLVPEDPLAARGLDLAVTAGCFSCHGHMGGGGTPNPGSFKGYVPGFWGHDFRDLVRSDDELHEWIREGSIRRLAESPLGSWFLERQTIKMPAYRRFLSEEDIAALGAAVRWIHGRSWEQQPLLE